jgi:hypothetical protein
MMGLHDNRFNANGIPRASFRSIVWATRVLRQDEQSCVELETETGNPQMSKS